MQTVYQRAMILEDAEIAMYTGVTYGTNEGQCKKPTADNAVFAGVVDNDERLQAGNSGAGSQAGKAVAVKMLGVGQIKLSGTCAVGERLILGNTGVAKKLPAGAGQYNIIGYALKIGANGDVVPFDIKPHTWTVV
jgi:hypothetical protein